MNRGIKLDINAVCRLLLKAHTSQHDPNGNRPTSELTIQITCNQIKFHSIHCCYHKWENIQLITVQLTYSKYTLSLFRSEQVTRSNNAETGKQNSNKLFCKKNNIYKWHLFYHWESYFRLYY